MTKSQTKIEGNNAQSQTETALHSNKILQGRDYEVKIQQFLMMVPHIPLRAYSGGFRRH